MENLPTFVEQDFYKFGDPRYPGTKYYMKTGQTPNPSAITVAAQIINPDFKG